MATTPTQSLPDRAAVAFHPPLLLLPLVAFGFIGSRLVPAPFLPDSWTIPVGIPIFVFAWFFLASAVITMLRGGASAAGQTACGFWRLPQSMHWRSALASSSTRKAISKASSAIAT